MPDRIEDAISYLQAIIGEAVRQGFHDIRIQRDCYYDGDTDTVVGLRKETEEEKEKRLKRSASAKKAAKKKREAKEAREKKLYEKLKQKYGEGEDV